MSSPRLRAKPDPVRAALAEARAHGLRQRQRIRLENARGRELTHRCRRCGDVVHLIGYVRHLETCGADEPP
jgi:hypothetical protein